MSKATERLYLRGDPPIEVHLRRSARAVRLSLRVSRLDGTVTMSLPETVPQRTAEKFLAQKAAWVRQNVAEGPRPWVPALGDTMPVEGRDCRIVAGRPGLSDREIRVDPRRSVPPQIAALLKARARDRLAPACDRYARAVGRDYARLTLRDTRSRWGSCTSGGNLMFSWRLAMAPAEILDYVAAHEVAHLVHMNHSTRFWQLVGRLCPGYADHRAWLRGPGRDLHAARFRA
ncbi:MAG: M48 family metallopeptidase [Rhodobacteraceae bacterium]|nr:M48 family metallopeptidase [Paracoccaceae bacterium]